jgi:hypothetical protein
VIDWARILANGIWVLGLALMLADLSYQYWLSGERGWPLREMWRGFTERLTTWIGLALIAGGLAGTSTTLWETGLWLLFLLVAVYFGAKSWRTDYRDMKANGN